MTLEEQQYNNSILTVDEEKNLNNNSCLSKIKNDIQEGLPDKKVFQELFKDWDMLQIYLKMSKKPYSRKGIGKTVGIPTTTVFRKVNWLFENGLIKISKKTNVVSARTGKNEQMFIACFTKIFWEFGNNTEILHASESREIVR